MIKGNAVVIGDYLFSDGTWGTTIQNPEKTPIAQIFSNTTSKKDQLAGYIHGYAIALTDADSNADWGTENGEQDVIWNETNEDTDGYTMKKDIESFLSSDLNQGLTMKKDWAAEYIATNYDIIAPKGSSGWYLPSSGQWKLITENLLEIDENLYVRNNGGFCANLKNGNIIKAATSKIPNYKGNTYYLIDKTGDNWKFIEDDLKYCGYDYFIGEGWNGNIVKSNACVRSVIAF